MKNKSPEQLIFPIFIAATSLMNIVHNFKVFFWSSILISIVGLAGSALFFMNIKKASIFFYIWILAQFITLLTHSFSYVTNQIPYYFFGLTFGNSSFILVINFTPILLLIGYELLKMNDFVGKGISIRPIKADSPLKPIEGEITGIVNRNMDGKWFKVTYMEKGQPDIQNVLIKSKDSQRLSRNNAILVHVNHSTDQMETIDLGKAKLK